MRILQVSDGPDVRPAAVDPGGAVRMLDAWIDGQPEAWLHPEALCALDRRFQADYARLPVAREVRGRVVAPVAPAQVISIGLNYVSHAREAGLELPPEPVVALKSPHAVAGPYDDLPIPEHARAVDWEVELAVVIGRRTQYLSGPEDSSARIAGYCVANDLSDREWLLARQGQWTKGKSFEGFAPLGPYLVTPASLPDPGDLSLGCWVNGTRMQAGSTADMRFGVDFLVFYLSQFMVLAAGDVILTGSPGGNALGRPGQAYLRPGDRLVSEIAGLGRQAKRCVRAPAGVARTRAGPALA
jgi:2-keto-4-pentenoate hydratase/2-oxohepta-3-ene-1,7-dioic acid hydratase in catechol pathway